MIAWVPRALRRWIAVATSLAAALVATPQAARAEDGRTAGDVATRRSPIIEPGKARWIAVPGDRRTLVIDGPEESSLAVVYLHGLCGNIHAVEDIAGPITSRGTIVALLGDRACGRGRFKWNKDPVRLAERIDRALAVVKAARGGHLDVEHPILFGYSQGAARAEKLVERYPLRYQLVVLGGPPRRPALARLGDALAVAVFGGERESTDHMRAGAELLAAAGRPARFFLLPGARHGEFGSQGSRVLEELFAWLLRDHGASRTTP
ncbi:MAG TPA: hypothetical protein VKY73_21710 [Polyangiaceae bacterium]|nr:hypothetical protein [Polyangiaceae bacterium]